MCGSSEKDRIRIDRPLCFFLEGKNKTSPFLNRAFGGHHSLIIELMGTEIIRFLNLLNIYNIFSLDRSQNQETDLRILHSKIESDPNLVHLLLKNSFECKRLSIDDLNVIQSSFINYYAIKKEKSYFCLLLGRKKNPSYQFLK